MTAPVTSLAVAAGGPPGGHRRQFPAPLLGLLGVAGFLAMLELLPRVGVVDPRFLPPFSAMMAALADEVSQVAFWTAAASTVRGWAIGLAIASVLGIVLGILIGSVPVLRAATSSTIEFLRPIPSVALIPLAVLIYGTEPQSTLILVVYACFWQVLIQVLYGVQDVDPVARETARSYRFRPWTQVRTVIWPTALPFVMTGFRLAAAVALVLEITGELVIGSPGLGKRIAIAQSSSAEDTLYALVIVAGAFGVLVNLVARALEKRALHWHPSMRREVPT